MGNSFSSTINTDTSIGAGNFLWRYVDTIENPSTLLMDVDHPYPIGGRVLGPRVALGDFAEAQILRDSMLGVNHVIA